MRTLTFESGVDDDTYDLVETLSDGMTRLISTALFGMRLTDIDQLQKACARVLLEHKGA